jgi:uncharacterized protein (UPF0335 family)
MDPEVHRRLRIIAAEQGKYIGDVIADLVRQAHGNGCEEKTVRRIRLPEKDAKELSR